MSYESVDRALEREIRIIEEDDSLTNQEKRDRIVELEKEARDILREERARERDEEDDNW